MNFCYSPLLKLSLVILSFSLSFCHQKEQNEKKIFQWFAANAIANEATCREKVKKSQSSRAYQTGFESLTDFSGFYVVPQNYQNTASHELQTGMVFSGNFAHRGWIYNAGSSCPSWQNCNHRGYPTIQLYKTPQGSFRTPVFIEFQANLNVVIAKKQWFSFATFSADASDNWNRVVLVNVGHINNSDSTYLHLMHVPNHGESNWTHQTSDSNNPVPWSSTPGWVKISVCLDFHPDTGFAKVWQNGTLVSTASVKGGCGFLEQAHFGLYAPPDISSGEIYNDDLVIREIAQCP